jgi:hypothetical protein
MINAAPPLAASAVLTVAFNAASATLAAGDVCYADTLIFEPGTGGRYFDGSSIIGNVSDFQWAGTANDSSSLYFPNYQAATARLVAATADEVPAGTVYEYTWVASS